MGKASRRLTYLNKILDETDLVKELYPVFKSNTPKRSGNARRKTLKSGNGIKAAYPYAGKLDDGYSSKSPKGMTIPTIQHLRSYIKRKLN
jgi:hypothetical protein